MTLSKRKYLKIATEELIIRALTFDYFFIRKAMTRELSHLNTDAVLDIGSGTGLLSSYFSATGYMGIDVDPMLIEFARMNHADYQFKLMNAGHLSFPNNFFSSALFVGAIHHINDTTFDNMCRKLTRVLKKDSVILAIEPIPSHWFNILGRTLRAHDKGHHILGFEDYKKRLGKYFLLLKSYKQTGGLIDYGVFMLRNTKPKK